MSLFKRTSTLFVGIACFGLLAGMLPATPPAASETAFLPAHRVLLPDADGEKVYNSRCMSCHQMDGKGIPGVFPPLNESEFVVGSPQRLVRIILHGMMGETTVKGVTYSGMMPPWGSFLSDEEVAAVITYIRSNFDNDASAITPELVAEIRAATADRKQPWTEPELEPYAEEEEHEEGDDGETEGGDG